MSNVLKIAVLEGDGVGPEITVQALRVLKECVTDRSLEIQPAHIGGAAIDAEGTPFPESTRAVCTDADAVLLGAVGGPKWDSQPPDNRPEKGLLQLRQALGVYANVRPVRCYDALSEHCPLKQEVVRGTDLVVVRELLSGIYFGEPRGEDAGDDPRAFNTMVYTKTQVERVARRAFELARQRKKRLMSIDKANVLEVSRLWRRTVTALSSDYPDVELSHQYVDSAAMDLIRQPTKFDVIVTGNLFGDILTDEAAVLAGSIGLLPSASLGDGPGLYEPIHGSAPDIAGKNIANPLGCIASVASMLRSSLDLPDQAARIEAAIESVLTHGHRTQDLGGQLTTTQIGDEICRALTSQ